MAKPANPEQKSDWRRYKLSVEDVYACAFTPDSKAVAFLYCNDRLLSESPWRDIYTSHLAVWDFKRGTVEEKLKWDYMSNSQGDPWPFQSRYLEYTADGRLLVYLGPARFQVLDANTYAVVRQFAFDPPREKVPSEGDMWATVGLSLTPDGSRAAVAISSSGSRGGGFLRVYNLTSGDVLREWRLRDGVFYVTGAALSPDGERVAVSWLPVGRSSDPEAFIPAGIENVRVMDVNSGQTVAGVNTKYVAGPVLFGPNDTLLTGSINSDRKGYSLDTIKVWDARTGRLLREIANPHEGVHYRLGLSLDGSLLLGYTGTEKPVENFVNIDSQQFGIWEFASGKLKATSPKILPVKDVNFPPRMELSPDGRFVIVWWGEDFVKPNYPLVYEMPQH